MKFITIPIRNLGKRPVRTSLTITGIAVAIASFTALVAVSRGVGNAWTGSLAARGTHIVATNRDSVEVLTASLDDTLGKQIETVPGVRNVAGELVDLINVESRHTVIAVGWAPDEYMWREWQLSEGAKPGHDNMDGVILGSSTAQAMGKTIRDKIKLHDKEFTIMGISQYAGSLNDGALVMKLSALQELMNRPGKVTGFHIRLQQPDNEQSAARVKKDLGTAFPTLIFNETREIAENNRMLQLLRAAAWSNSVIAIIMGLIVVLNTLAMSVIERTFEIGVLSAVGWTARRILSMIMLEGVILAVAGSALGCLAGMELAHLLARMPQARGFLEIHFTTRQIIEVCLAALFLGIAGSLYPAWRAVRLHPVEALKHE
ncbi:MAG: ABC transporter permease [bacterium]|nr:ABC transporter permease [Candidatus Sumerlaeota bacterium]